jgi:membrane fusion protein, heavy metal efflux system
MTRSIRARLIGGAALTLVTLLSACSKQSTTASHDENAATQPELFTVPTNQMSRVQVVTVEPSSWPRVLRLTGTVAFNGFDTTPVITQVGGPVSRIIVTPGQQVRKGEPMLFVSSPDYSQLRATFLKARDVQALAPKSYVRAEDLYNHHAIAARDLEAAESAEVQAQADLNAAEQALKVLGVPRPDALAVGNSTSPEVAVSAPIAGEVVERLCAPGQVIQTGQTQCFTISNMRSVWVMVNVYENQMAYVHVGDPATITTDVSNTEFHGRISYMGAALDPTSRTLQARIDTTNINQILKKDMYVTATVTAGNISNALMVPDSAVLRDTENKPYVYMQNTNGQFAHQSVELGESQGGKTLITSGLKPGDKVAGDGSLFLQFANSQQQ